MKIALKWINKVNNAEPTEDISKYYIFFDEEVNDYIAQNRGEQLEKSIINYGRITFDYDKL